MPKVKEKKKHLEHWTNVIKRRKPKARTMEFKKGVFPRRSANPVQAEVLKQKFAESDSLEVEKILEDSKKQAWLASDSSIEGSEYGDNPGIDSEEEIAPENGRKEEENEKNLEEESEEDSDEDVTETQNETQKIDIVKDTKEQNQRRKDDKEANENEGSDSNRSEDDINNKDAPKPAEGKLVQGGKADSEDDQITEILRKIRSSASSFTPKEKTSVMTFVRNGGSVSLKFQCLDCDHESNRADHLRNHMLSQHGRKKDDPFFKTLIHQRYRACPGCKVLKSNMSEHARTCKANQRKGIGLLVCG